jgi:hypothetical protein
MARDRTEQVPQPTDPSADDVVAIDGAASRDADTEAHSMLTLELARTIDSERLREAERMSRNAAHVREARSSRVGGFLKRFGRR